MPFSWLLSAIYASPKFKNRCILWDKLKKVSDHHDLLWILIGNFNDMIEESEKLGGNPLSVRRVREYRECMDHRNLLDLGFSVPKFTWTNKRDIGNLIQERLDRCWATPSWKVLFPEANVSHLARINLDHCPLLVKLTKPPPTNGERPFCFQPMWNHHPAFQDLVRGAWRENALERATHEFTMKARQWN